MRLDFTYRFYYASNTVLNAGSGGDIISDDQITTLNGVTIATGEKVQRVKPSFGSAGSAHDVDTSNGLPIQGAQTGVTTASWTSATALNQASTISIANLNTVTVAIVPTTTFTGGVISFEVSPDNVNWFSVQMARVDSYTVESTYTIVASTNRAWSTSVDGFTNFRVRLSTVIAGTGTLTVLITAQVFAVEPIITVGQSAAASLNATIVQATAANLQATVTQQAITKGTQGTNGVTTQDLKDSGRVLFAAVASAVTGSTSEALVTLTPYRDLTAGSTATTFAVTAGKRLSLQSIIVTWRNNTAAAGGVTIRFRMLAGTVLVGSPVVLALNASTALATAGSGASAVVDFPDGFELSGTMQFGITQIAVGAVVGFDVTIIGFEY